VILGDHKQLRPSVTVYELGKHYNFDVSLFERMVINRDDRCVTLQVQHRMCPEMAKLIVPTIYKTLENHESVLERPQMKSLTKRLFFKTHSEEEKHVSLFLYNFYIFTLNIYFRILKIQAEVMSLRQHT